MGRELRGNVVVLVLETGMMGLTDGGVKWFERIRFVLWRNILY